METFHQSMVLNYSYSIMVTSSIGPNRIFRWKVVRALQSLPTFFSVGINVLYIVQGNLWLKPFGKCHCLFFSGAQNQYAFSSFQNCYIKMSWHMCLKCKIHKKKKNPFNVDGILLLPFLHGTKSFPSLSFMTRFKSHLFTNVWRRLCFSWGL